MKLIGKGMYSRVYECEYGETGEAGAAASAALVKKVYLTDTNSPEFADELYDAFKNEVRVLELLKKSGVEGVSELISYQDLGHNKENYIILRKYHDLGNINLESDIQQLTAIINQCHYADVQHNDVKWKNIKRDNMGNIVLIDWNLAKIGEPDKQRFDKEELALMIVEQLIGLRDYEQMVSRYEDTDPEDKIYMEENYYYNKRVWEESDERLYWQSFIIELLGI